MGVFLVGRIKSIFTLRREMEGKKTRPYIPDPKEESKKRVIGSSLESSSVEHQFRWRCHLPIRNKMD